MSNLYSNIPPLTTSNDQETILEAFHSGIAEADRLEIAVGYVTSKSLEELASLVEKYHVSEVVLVCGMYRDGIPSDVKDKIVRIQQNWNKTGTGNIYLVDGITYHGKIYTFWKNNKVFQSIVGSANLSTLAPNQGSGSQQYEFAVTIDDEEQNKQISEFIHRLLDETCVLANEIDKFPVIEKVSHTGRGKVPASSMISDDESKLTESTLEKCNQSLTDKVLKIEIKAPKLADLEQGKRTLMGSNINVCYANSNKRPRSWYEAQLNISKNIKDFPRKIPFFIVTEEGNVFLAETKSQGNKQLSVSGSDLILGKWLKGRLVRSKLIKPINSRDELISDGKRLVPKGAITQELLEQANMRYLILRKTKLKKEGTVIDSNGHSVLANLDVWVASFEA